MTIPESYKYSGAGVDADLVIFLSVSNEPNTSPSWASACISNFLGRPIAGQININLPYLETKPSSFQNELDKLIHQVK